MKYVDGFVIAVPEKNMDAYRAMAKMGAEIWMKHGALEYFECVGDDLSPAMPGGVTGIRFPQMVKAKPDEKVIFSFIVFKSRADRDRINGIVMNDPVMNNPEFSNKPMPFDPERMAYGGFTVLVEK